jgi:hypothetical protein
MATFLDSLIMGLQGGGNAIPQEDDVISVTAKPLPVRTIPEDTRTVKPTSRRQEQQEETPELIKRKGRFGVGGTLRDILGTIGDAYLIGNGRTPLYDTRRREERIASNQYGFTQDPAAAAERVGELDDAAARDLYKAYSTVDIQKTNAERQQANTDRQFAKDEAIEFAKNRQVALNMMSAAQSPGEQKMILQWLKEGGRDFDSLPLHLVAAGGINRYQQEMIPIQKERTDISRQNANANTTRANRPPQPRAAPNPTAASIIAPLAEKIRKGQTLTPGEQKVYDDLRPSRGKSKRALPALPPGFK